MPPQAGMELATPKFNRRQSYDTLSTMKISAASNLSLGPLPLPNFSELPNGQRSVPVPNSTHRLTSGGIASHRNVFGPSSGGIIEAPRTPGGSLVIGSEVFGFGRHQSNLLGKERWGSGVIEGESIVDKDEGLDQQTPKGETDPTRWPTDYVGGVNGDESGDFQLDHSNDFNVDESNQEFNSNFSRPSMQSYGSTNDIRSHIQPSSQRPTISRTQSSIPLHTPATATTVHSATGLDLEPIANSTVGFGTVPSATVYAGNLPGELNPYIMQNVNQGYSARPNQNAYGVDLEYSQINPDDLALGLGNFSLGPDVPSHNNQSRNNGGVNNNRGEYTSRDSMSMSRQTSTNSALYNPYYYPQVQPFPLAPQQITHDPYTGVAYVDTASATFYQPPSLADLSHVNNLGNGGNTRRDSGYASSSTPYTKTSPHLFRRPSISNNNQNNHNNNNNNNNNNWNQNHLQQQQLQQHVVPPIAMSDYAPSSSQNSRHGSFSFSPALSQVSLASYGSSPGGNGINSNHLQLNNHPQMQQHHQQFNNNNNHNNHNSNASYGMSGGRGGGGGGGGRNDYIAPGPSLYENSPSNYGVYGGGNGYRDQEGGRYSEDLIRVVRSPILEDFRISRHRSWELSDIVGHVVEFSGDQLGSRHIQTKLESASQEEKNLVFEEILPNLLKLSTDVFANYVIQKFFEQGSSAQKTAMAQVLEGHVLELSLQMYGCRVVQKALEYVPLDQQVRLIKELDGHVLKCSRDAQSNHVVQRALERVPSAELTFITDACIGQVPSLATHPYGCRVLQRIFENCHTAQTQVLLEELHLYTQTLIQDQYGNYVIQWIVERGQPKDRSMVISKIHGQVLQLAQQKFASNVIEKCIVHATEQERYALIEEILAPASDGSSVIKAALQHPFANYVMQKILQTAVGNQRDALFIATSIELANLRKYASSYSKHLIAIEKLLTSERSRTY